MTRQERKELRDKHFWQVLECDECRIEIGTATWYKAHVIMSDHDMIAFTDDKGRQWQSNERYTLVVTKEINEDDEQDD